MRSLSDAADYLRMKKQLFEKFEQFRMKVLVVLREKEYITLSMLL